MKTSIRRRLAVGIRIKMVPTIRTIKLIRVYPTYTDDTQATLDKHRKAWTLFENGWYYFVRESNEWTNNRIGIVREIVKIQSNSIKFSDGSWLEMVKASECEDTMNGFRVWETDIDTGVTINHLEYVFTDEPLDQEYHNKKQRDKEESARAIDESYATTRKNRAEDTLKKKNIKTENGIVPFLTYFTDQFANGSKWKVHAWCIQVHKANGYFTSWRLAGFADALAILFPDHRI